MDKHYRIAQDFERQLTDSLEVLVLRVDTEDNPSDTFTKPLPRASFEKHRLAVMGPQEDPDH